MLQPISLELIHAYTCVQTILSTLPRNALIVTNIERYNFNFPVNRIDTSTKLHLVNLNLSDYKRYMSKDLFFARKQDAYLIELDSATALNTMKHLQMSPTFNPTAKFIFIVEQISTNIVDILRSYFIKDVIFLNIGQKRRFSPTATFKGVMETCESHNLSSEWTNAPTKKNGRRSYSFVFLEYPPYAICLDCKLQGIEVDILNFISERMNIQIEYTEIKAVALPLKFLVLEKSFDAVAGGVIFYNPFIEHSVNYMQDYISWYLPVSEEVEKWKYIHRVFSSGLWILFAGIIILMTTIWSFTTYISDRKKPGDYIEIFFMFLRINMQIFLEQTQNLKIKFHSQQMLLVCSLFLFFFMNMLYKIRFTYFLVGVNFEDDIRSMGEISDRKFKILMFEGMISFFDEDPSMRSYIKLMFQECDKSSRCLDEVAFERRGVVFRLRSNAEYFARFEKYHDRFGRWLLKRMEYYGVPWPRKIRFRLGHPLFPSFNRYLLLMTEFGFIDYIASNYYVKFSENIPVENHSFRLDHLKAPFVLWIFGIVISSIIFYFEVSKIIGRQK